MIVRRQLSRYILGGLLCALMNNAILIGADRVSLHYLPALFLSFFIVTPVGYLFHTWHTFDGALSWKRFLGFAGGMAAGFPLSLAAMFIFCSLLRLPVVIAAPLATLVLFAWNFASARWAISARGR